MTSSSQLDIRVVFSLQYRSYLRPTDRWHYGSVDYLDPLCTTALYFTFAGLALHKYTLRRRVNVEGYLCVNQNNLMFEVESFR